jgi:hypothetical protein
MKEVFMATSVLLWIVAGLLLYECQIRKGLKHYERQTCLFSYYEDVRGKKETFCWWISIIIAVITIFGIVLWPIRLFTLPVDWEKRGWYE